MHVQHMKFVSFVETLSEVSCTTVRQSVCTSAAVRSKSFGAIFGTEKDVPFACCIFHQPAILLSSSTQPSVMPEPRHIYGSINCRHASYLHLIMQARC
jgi:hypothetical protein